ncbi:MAG: hypothetical protein R2734_07375 [Nocardioides sp.]
MAASDSDEFGAFTEILAWASAQLVAYLTVAFIVIRTSVPLGRWSCSPLRCWSAWRCRCCALHRCQELERTRNLTLPRWPPTSSPGCASCAASRRAHVQGRNYAAQSQSARSAGVSAGLWQAAIESDRGAVLGRLPGAVGVAWRG